MTSAPYLDLPSFLKSCGDGHAAKQLGVDTLGAVVVILHTGGSGLVVVLHWNFEAAVESGSPLGDQAALFRIALLAPVEWGRG